MCHRMYDYSPFVAQNCHNKSETNAYKQTLQQAIFFNWAGGSSVIRRCSLFIGCLDYDLHLVVSLGLSKHFAFNWCLVPHSAVIIFPTHAISTCSYFTSFRTKIGQRCCGPVHSRISISRDSGKTNQV
jgi:hypothetical protein